MYYDSWDNSFYDKYLMIYLLTVLSNILDRKWSLKIGLYFVSVFNCKLLSRLLFLRWGVTIAYLRDFGKNRCIYRLWYYLLVKFCKNGLY